MTKDQGAFEKWLDGKMFWAEGSETRRDFAERRAMNMFDIHWAFCAGFNEGLLKGLEEGSK